MSALTDAQYELFEHLTSRPFVVVDLEWAWRDRTEHIVSMAVVPVVRGKRVTSEEYYQVVNPGVAIDARTRAKHGFTDDMVKRKPKFAKVAGKLLDALGLADAIFVSHGAIDARVIGDHLKRLGDEDASPLGFEDLPDLPLIDTTRLARLVQHPAAGHGSAIGLEHLCGALGVRLSNHHNAKYDARATADALISLLQHAAREATFGSIEDLLRAADHGTARAPRGALYIQSDSKAPALPAAHLQRHAAEPMTHAASEAERDLWMERATECVSVRCGLLWEEVALAAPNNGAALLEPLAALFDAPLEPGQAGTAAGALEALLRASGPLAAAAVTSPALPSARVTFWWRKFKLKVDESARCSTYAGEACRACWEGDGCPRDLLYQQVVHATVLAKGTEGLTREFVRDRLIQGSSVGGSEPKVLDRWAKDHPREAAYAVDLICQSMERRGRTDAPYLSWARERGVELQNPALALRVLSHEASARGLAYAIPLAEEALSIRTTDPAFQTLESWLAMQAAAAEQQRRASVPRVIVKPRLARPAGRVPVNPYRPF